MTKLESILPKSLPFPWVVARKEKDLVVYNEILHVMGIGGLQKDIGLSLAIHTPTLMNGDEWVQIVMARPTQPPLLADLEVARTLIFGEEKDAIYRVPKKSESKDPRQATLWVKLDDHADLVIAQPGDLSALKP